ncbi:MAG TPA: hypothetical protein PL001_02370 [Candidatus Kryptobacter bacterium]|nr:hypothetical protein [Candidatus Kryptobacter bacterium]
MTGKIFRINRPKQMIAILTANGDFSVFENIGELEFEIDDEVSWENDNGVGGQRLHNITQQRDVDVYFENHQVSKEILKVQLRES